MAPKLRIGQYHLDEEIAEGAGHTTLWRAHDKAGRAVVIKLISKPRDRTALAKTRGYFEDEVQAGRALVGRNVRALLDSGELDEMPGLGYHRGAFYLVMELIDFGSLRDLLKSRPLTGDEVRDLIVAVARGLGEAHGHVPPICHRDLKPENILLPDARCANAKVSDFGISRILGGTRMTTVGFGVGTGRYMPPEQFRGSSTVETSADLYSFALMVVECLTGSVPYDCDDDWLTFEARKAGEPIADLVVNGRPAAAVSSVLRSALHSDPASRPRSSDRFGADLVAAGVEDGVWSPIGSSGIQLIPGIEFGEFWILGGLEIEEEARRMAGGTGGVSFARTGDIVTGGAPAWRIQLSAPSNVTEDRQGAGKAQKREPSTSSREPATRALLGSSSNRKQTNKNQRSSTISKNKTHTPPRESATRSLSAAFMSPVTPDDELAQIVGPEPLPRTELTKKLWTYIKRKGLQDKQNRRMINSDDKLRPVFGGKDQVSMFDMTKLINKHFK